MQNCDSFFCSQFTYQRFFIFLLSQLLHFFINERLLLNCGSDYPDLRISLLLDERLLEVFLRKSALYYL